MPTIDVKIPPVGESILTGVLARWRVADGDIVARDQPLFELETDKITSEGMAEAAGKITLGTAEGTEVKIGEVVATIDTENKGLKAERLKAERPEPEPETPQENPLAAFAASVSPAVARIVAETGIDPATVPGTGKGGRVTKADLLAAAEAAPAIPPPPPAGRQTRKKLSPLRKRLAERLVQAQHQAAMLTTFNEADMSAVMELRKKYQDDFVKKNGIKLGIMSFFTKAVVHALQAVPGINARIEGDEIVRNSYYDVGVAVSTDKGLMVPVIRDCDTASMAGIEQQLGDLAKRARDGKITLPDLEGGVFTITNGGIFGSMLSTPILNAPQSAILGLHAINERPVAVNGQVVIRPMMYLALSYDHRLVDGKEAVTFLVKVKQAIEDPTRLLLNL